MPIRRHLFHYFLMIFAISHDASPPPCHRRLFITMMVVSLCRCYTSVLQPLAVAPAATQRFSLMPSCHITPLSIYARLAFYAAINADCRRYHPSRHVISRLISRLAIICQRLRQQCFSTRRYAMMLLRARYAVLLCRFTTPFMLLPMMLLHFRVFQRRSYHNAAMRALR